MLIFHRQISLDEGFDVMAKPKGSRLVAGKNVSNPSGKLLFEALRAVGQPLKCWHCGVEANCFIVNKGKNDKLGPPVLDLYADTGTDVVLMTRDHIIPKSYGGVNDVPNLRVGCGPCNHDRGNALDAEDIAFMKAHPELMKATGEHLVLDASATEVEKRVGAKAVIAEVSESNNKLKKKAKKDRAKARKKANAFPKLTTMLVLALA